ncbi:hypothetical protein [Isoptericola sp. NPDC057191]|uniref:hypothetical protein n=1 Tax=Isoptericola sp. NPDC057191 TaxID=3346041 RepID=UPI003633ACBE
MERDRPEPTPIYDAVAAALESRLGLAPQEAAEAGANPADDVPPRGEATAGAHDAAPVRGTATGQEPAPAEPAFLPPQLWR